jgi:hypothetical protein
MRLISHFLLLISACPILVNAQIPGPYYFVSDVISGEQFYWRSKQGFAGVTVLQNYNLLAAVLGDTPRATPGTSLVPEESYDYGDSGPVRLQPFAVMTRLGKKIGLPPGPELTRFLNDPLRGAKFDLSLPFKDPNVALSNQSALLRRNDDESSWHIAIDFDYTGNSSNEFDIHAAADGLVIGQLRDAIVIRHQASNRKHFLTIYKHLDPSSVVVRVNQQIKRGDFLGKLKADRTGTGSLYAHLHFAVAVKGPSRVINGTKVPELWYLIDPFGVYDYRRNRNSSTSYNYLPDNRMDKNVRGRIHAYVFKTDPPINSLPAVEDCISFNYNEVRITGSGSSFQLVDGSHSLFSFPNQGEAIAARDKIRYYRMNKSCFIGRPNADFNYLLAGNASPRGGHTPEDCISFLPTILKIVRNRNGTFNLNAGNTLLYRFPNQKEADQAKEIIIKYGFTKSCFVGRPDPSFHYLRR